MLQTYRQVQNSWWDELTRFQEEMNRFFAPLTRQIGRVGFGPLMNVWEDDAALYAETDLPGIDASTLDVQVVEGNQLVIKGERKAPEYENTVWHRQERGYGEFMRAIALPKLVDADKVEAKYTDGVLRLTLPKHEAAKPRKISVHGG